MFARSRVQSTDLLAAVAAAASSAASPAAAASLGRANIAARQFIVYESTASHAARPREQSHLFGTRATRLRARLLPILFSVAILGLSFLPSSPQYGWMDPSTRERLWGGEVPHERSTHSRGTARDSWPATDVFFLVSFWTVGELQRMRGMDEVIWASFDGEVVYEGVFIEAWLGNFVQ